MNLRNSSSTTKIYPVKLIYFTKTKIKPEFGELLNIMLEKPDIKSSDACEGVDRILLA